MKNNKALKLSPLEELRQRKAVLQEECRQDEERFFNVVDNVRHNWKSLLIGSVFSSSKSFVGSLLSSAKGDSGFSGSSGGVFQKMLPLAWTVLQPILMKIVLNKIKNFFVKTKK